MELSVFGLIVVVAGLTVVLVWVLRGRDSDRNPLSDAVKAEFQSLSQEALTRAQDQFLTLADQRFARQTEAGTRDLDTKKQLIDQQLELMNTRLEQVSRLVNETEYKRQASFGQLTTHIQAIGQQTTNLIASTTTLREALSSSRTRGQWGERMADDILRALGFVEGVNYYRQEVIEGVGSRPDFVFPLSDGLRVNMDVKFPFENYVKFLGEEAEGERERHKNAFLRDVRSRVKEVTTREYIDPEGGTVDYVLLFVPNESVYSFIHETDPGMLDAALQERVICCSPFTLFAVLAVVRQAVDNFALQKASEEIISLLGRFNNEWERFEESLTTLGRRLNSVQTTYEQITGTRKRQLERPLRRIEALRQEKGLSVASCSVELEEAAGEDAES